MSEQKSTNQSVTVFDTAADALASVGAKSLGDLPAGTVLQRETVDVTTFGSAYRELVPGGVSIKAGS